MLTSLCYSYESTVLIIEHVNINLGSLLKMQSLKTHLKDPDLACACVCCFSFFFNQAL